MHPELRNAEQRRFASQLIKHFETLLKGLQMPATVKYTVLQLDEFTLSLSLDLEPEPWVFILSVSGEFNDSDMFQQICQRAAQAGIPKSMLVSIVEAAYRFPNE